MKGRESSHFLTYRQRLLQPNNSFALGERVCVAFIVWYLKSKTFAFILKARQFLVITELTGGPPLFELVYLCIKLL